MKKIILFLVVIILIPVLIVKLDYNKVLLKNSNFGYVENKIIKVKEHSTGNIIEVPIEEYVLGVVAGELPASFDIESLKAQAVASRTYVLKKAMNNNKYDVTDTTEDQVYINETKRKEKWKKNYDEYNKKFKEAVNSTKKEVILYNDNLIEALFFSTSNGYTENSEDVFTSNKPYLVSVESNWDTVSPSFNSTNEISKSEFLLNLGLKNTNEINITNIEKTNTGRIKTLVVNGTKFKSSDIRKIFSLKSTSFNIKINNDKVIFEVKGFGHGVGMSQYGANGMAKQGYNYKDILRHYYSNCDIKKLN